MSSPIQFSVDDTSPTINYQPFADTLSTPSLGLGWNPYYSISGFSNALGTIGQGQSFHVTSLNGASFTIHWHGTGIQLLGNVTDASFVIILDGRLNQSTTFDPSNNILATYQELPDADHNITLQVVTPTTQEPPDSHTLFFDKALIIAAPPPDTPPKTTFSQLPLDDSDIAYTGLWSIVNHGSSGSFHQTSTAGDRVQSTFNGTTFQLTGATSPLSGRYSVTLDNVTTTLSAQSSFTNFNSLLYYASGLSAQQPHSVEIVNEAGTLTVQVGGFLVDMSTNATTVPTAAVTSATAHPVSNTSQSFPKGTVAALALAGVLAFVLISIALFYFFVWKPRQRRLRRERREGRRRPKQEVTERGSGAPATGRLGSVIVDIGPEPVVLHHIKNGNGNGQQRTGSGFDRGSAGWIGVEIDSKRRDSPRGSGFTKWKKDVESGFGREGMRGFGMAFRSPDSTGQKHGHSSKTDHYEYYEHDGRDSGSGTDEDDDGREDDKSPGLPQLSSLGVPYEGDQKGKGRSTTASAKPKSGTHKPKTKSVRSTSSWTPSFTLDLSRFKSRSSNGSPRYIHSRNNSQTQTEPLAGASGGAAGAGGRATPGSPTSVPHSPHQTSLASSLSTFSYFSFISGRSQAQQQQQHRQGSSGGSSGLQPTSVHAPNSNSNSNSQPSKPPSPSVPQAALKSSLRKKDIPAKKPREGSTITSSTTSSLSPPQSVPRSAVSIPLTSRSGSPKSEVSKIQIPDALIEISVLPTASLSRLDRPHESRRATGSSPVHPYAAAATEVRESGQSQGRYHHHSRAGSTGPLLSGQEGNEDEDMRYPPYAPGVPSSRMEPGATGDSTAVASAPGISADTNVEWAGSGRIEAPEAISPRTITPGAILFGLASGSSPEGTPVHEPLSAPSAPATTSTSTPAQEPSVITIVGGKTIRRLPNPPVVVPTTAPPPPTVSSAVTPTAASARPSVLRPPLPRPPTETSEVTPTAGPSQSLPQAAASEPTTREPPRPASSTDSTSLPGYLSLAESSPFSFQWRTLAEDSQNPSAAVAASAEKSAAVPGSSSATVGLPPYQRYPVTAPPARTVSLSLPARSIISQPPPTTEGTTAQLDTTTQPGPSTASTAPPELPSDASPTKTQPPVKSPFRLTPPSTAALQDRSKKPRHKPQPSDESAGADSSFLDFSGGRGHLRGSLGSSSATSGSASGLSRAASSTSGSTAWEREREAIAANHPNRNRHSAFTGTREAPPPVPPLPAELVLAGQTSPPQLPPVPVSGGSGGDDASLFYGLKSGWSATTGGEGPGSGSGAPSDSHATPRVQDGEQIALHSTPEPASSESGYTTSRPNLSISPPTIHSSKNSSANASQSSDLHIHPQHLSVSTAVSSNPEQQDTLGMSFAGSARPSPSRGSSSAPSAFDNTHLIPKSKRVSTGTSATNLTTLSNDPGPSPTESLPISDIRFGSSSDWEGGEEGVNSDWGSRRSSNWFMMTGPGAGAVGGPVTSSAEGLAPAGVSARSPTSPSPVGGIRTQRPPLPFPSLGSSQSQLGSSSSSQVPQQQHRHGSESSIILPPRGDSALSGGLTTPSYIVQRVLRPSGGSGTPTSGLATSTQVGQSISTQQQASRSDRPQHHPRRPSSTFFALLRGGNKDKEPQT